MYYLSVTPGIEVYYWSVTPGILLQARELRCLVQYMYMGESQVQSQQLDTFLQVGEELGICGLIKRGKDDLELDYLGQNTQSGQAENHDNKELVNANIKLEQNVPDNTKEDDTQKLHYAPGKPEAPLSFLDLVAPQKRQLCVKCDAQFSNMENLKKHNCNNIKATFECQTCKHKFQLESLLNQHIEAKHSGKPERIIKRRKKRSDEHKFQGVKEL